MRGTDRLMSVMDAIADYGPLSLTALALQVDLPKPTALRLLRSLEDGGWVAREDDGQYRTGARVLALAYRYLDGESLLRIASPHMLRLREEAQETVSLVARSGNLRVCVQEFPSTQPLKVTHGIGDLVPLVDSPASGLLLLAFATPEARAEVAAMSERTAPSVAGTTGESSRSGARRSASAAGS